MKLTNRQVKRAVDFLNGHPSSTFWILNDGSTRIKRAMHRSKKEVRRIIESITNHKEEE